MNHAKLTKLDSYHQSPLGCSPIGSIRDGYTVSGIYSIMPTVGRQFTMLRYSRNDVNVAGIYSTSEVQQVWIENGITYFNTLNSKYELCHHAT